jgi:hypothetical protein
MNKVGVGYSAHFVLTWIESSLAHKAAQLSTYFDKTTLDARELTLNLFLFKGAVSSKFGGSFCQVVLPSSVNQVGFSGIDVVFVLPATEPEVET